MSKTVPHKPGTWLDPATGREIAHHDLIASLVNEQAVLLGETHDRHDIHRWQLHVAAGLYARRADIALGFEMFPRSAQPVLDAWTAGLLDEKAFLEQSDWKTVWRFDPALYMPLFAFCRAFAIPMLALNCRRSLVSEVGEKGWEAVPLADRDGLTPALPATLAYKRHLLEVTGGRLDPGIGIDHPRFERFVRAQQTWDRAFACNVATALASHPERLVIGIIGRGHLEFGYGTPAQLRHLGIGKVSVLLPSDETAFDMGRNAGRGRAIFGLAG